MIDVFKTLMRTKYSKQVTAILDANSGDIDPSFLGFMDTYELLAKLIPANWTVYDFGCGYGFQCYFFRKHKRFIMVNPEHREEYDVFAPKEWCEYQAKTTGEFINSNVLTGRQNFAICNYVPPWHGENSGALVRKHFEYCYVFYP